MKPNFALKLSNDGIELIHRANSGWLSVGTVNFASDDVARGCADLVAEARRLEPGGIRTKLVLPESETRYTSVVAPGPTDEARRYQIEAEIESLTPYAVEELAYDWSVEGDYALVVVCAKETLQEAEGFAEGYGFNPVSFVAAPDAGQFNGEPFFGQTSVAARYLPSGQGLQRDAEPVRVTGVAPKAKDGPAATKEQAEPATHPEPAATASPPPTAPTTKSDATGSGSAAVSPPATGRTADQPAAPERTVASTQSAGADLPPARRGVPSMPAMPSEPLAKVGGLVRRMGTRLRREQAEGDGKAAQVAKPVTPPAQGKDNATTAKPAGAPVTAKAAQIAALVRNGKPDAETQGAGPGKRQATDEAHAEGGAVPFASRRRQGPGPAAETPDTPSEPAGPGGRIAVIPAKGGGGKRRGPGAQKGLIARSRHLAHKTLVATGLRKPPKPKPGRRRRAAGPEPIVPASRPPLSEREKATEAEALTIFGARGNQSNRGVLGGTALIASGAVLLLVVAVAVWALYFRGVDEPTQLAGVGDDNAGQVAVPSADPIEAPAALATPEEAGTQLGAAVPPAVQDPDPAPAGDADDVGDAPVLATPQPEAPTDPEMQGGDADAPVALAEGDVATDEGQAATDPDRLLEALVEEALNEALPEGDLPTGAQQDAVAAQDDDAVPAAGQEAATQLATRAGGGETTETPQLSGSGTAVRRLSLPGGFDVPSIQETAFTPPPPPPPPGTEFAFDERGLVEATPDGALTPSGVTVFARRPDLVPAPRPLSAIPREVLPPDFPRADPALADARPRARSDAIAEAVRAFREQQEQEPAEPEAVAPGDDQQDAALQPPAPAEVPGAAPPETLTAALNAPDSPPPGGVSLAALLPQEEDPRPQRRPTDLVPPPAAIAETPEQTDAGAVEAEGVPEIDLEGATEEAVAASLQPRNRPSDVAERAQAALAEAASVEEEREERQAEVRAAQPEIPTAASVARQATETDAIRLNRINLIGVFGTPDNRRVLVRLSSGRVVRVQVGDRLDGGQVTAIGEDELRYTKNGRNEILEIDG